MSPHRGDRGSVALELALTLPAVVAVMALGVGAVRVAAEGAAVGAAAVAAARAAAVEDDGAASRAAGRVVGSQAEVSVARDGGWVTVTVAVPMPWPWPDAQAVAALPAEP